MKRISSYEDELCKLRALFTKNYFGIEREATAISERRLLVESKLHKSNIKVCITVALSLVISFYN